VESAEHRTKSFEARLPGAHHSSLFDLHSPLQFPSFCALSRFKIMKRCNLLSSNVIQNKKYCRAPALPGFPGKFPDFIFSESA
jgi:hypothetical protein